jgi:hypothetical protein
MRVAMIAGLMMVMGTQAWAAGTTDVDQIVAKRRAHQADIDYYTSRYDGADLAAKANCAEPVMPSHSASRDGVKQVRNNIAAWSECYNQFIGSYNALLPAGKAIPADVAAVMTDAERKVAATRMDMAYTEIAMEMQRKAQALDVKAELWAQATSEFLKDPSYVKHFKQNYYSVNNSDNGMASYVVGSAMPGQRPTADNRR